MFVYIFVHNYNYNLNSPYEFFWQTILDLVQEQLDN